MQQTTIKHHLPHFDTFTLISDVGHSIATIGKTDGGNAQRK